MWVFFLSFFFRFQSSKSGKIYLHNDIRLLFSRKSIEVDTGIPYELKSFTEVPRNPKYSPRVWPPRRHTAKLASPVAPADVAAPVCASSRGGGVGVGGTDCWSDWSENLTRLDEMCHMQTISFFFFSLFSSTLSKTPRNTWRPHSRHLPSPSERQKKKKKNQLTPENSKHADTHNSTQVFKEWPALTATSSRRRLPLKIKQASESHKRKSPPKKKQSSEWICRYLF